MSMIPSWRKGQVFFRMDVKGEDGDAGGSGEGGGGHENQQGGCEQNDNSCSLIVLNLQGYLLYMIVRTEMERL